MKDAPAFDFYPERWLAGVADLTDAEQLAYLRLLCHQWLRQGLPDGVDKLRRLAGEGVTEELLEKFPVCEDGFRRNKRLEIIRGEQRERIARSREKIEKMNAARAAKLARQETLEGRLVEPLQDRLVDTRQDPSCRLPHHSPITTHPVLLEKEPKCAGAPGEAKRRKVEDLEDFEAACRVTLDCKNPALLQAWEEWQLYRQQRHHSKGAFRLPWTLRAAQLSAKQILQAVKEHGAQVVSDRIASAIVGNWQGLNLDKLNNSNGHAHPSNRQSGPHRADTPRFAALAAPAFDGDGGQTLDFRV